MATFFEIDCVCIPLWKTHFQKKLQFKPWMAELLTVHVTRDLDLNVTMQRRTEV